MIERVIEYFKQDNDIRIHEIGARHRIWRNDNDNMSVREDPHLGSTYKVLPISSIATVDVLDLNIKNYD
jgi:hypothetical protein